MVINASIWHFLGGLYNNDGISVAHVPCSLTMAHAQLKPIYDQGISHTMSGLEYARIWFNIYNIEVSKSSILVQDGAPKIAKLAYKWLNTGLW